jgi:hypothetical protein
MPHDVLEVLKNARAILATNYCKWTNDDRHGNHCAMGALQVASGGIATLDVIFLVDASSERLHPELKGKVSRRLNFDFTIGQLVDGQQAILDVFDDAIATLEVARLCAQVESEHPSLDVEKEAEGETVRSY